MWPASSAPAAIAYARELARDLGFAFAPGGIDVAGVPVGTDDFIATAVNARVEKIGRDIAELERAAGAPSAGDLPARQSIIRAMRMCCSSQYAHLQRALPPQHTEAGARAIDTMIFDACMRVAGVPRSSLPPDDTDVHAALRAQFRLPTDLGGMGLADSERAGALAFVTTAAMALPFLRRAAPGCFETDAHVSALLPDVVAGFRELQNRPGGLIAEGMPFVLWADGVASSSQHKLTHEQDLADFEILLAASAPADRLRILSSGGRGGGAWLHASPAYAAFRLADIQFCDAWTLRLGLRAAPAGPSLTADCRACTAAPGKNQHADGRHAGCCRGNKMLQNRAGGLAIAFNDSLEAGNGAFKTLGLASTGVPVQPTLLQLHGTGLRLRQEHAAAAAGAAAGEPGAGARVVADVRADVAWVVNRDETSRCAVDLVVISVNRDDITSSAQASTTAGFAARKAEDAKITHYSAIFDNFAAKTDRLVPAAVEMHGRLGDRFQTLIARLANQAFPHVALRKYDLDGLRARWITQTRQRISVALARGNSAMLASWRLRSWPAGM